MSPARKGDPKAAGALRAYFAALAPDARRELKKLREIIRAAAPGSSEAISYGIPAFRLGDKVLVYYAAWKDHSSLYPMGTKIRRDFATELEGYETSKGTIRFPRTRRIPVTLVKRLVKARIAEADDSAQ